MINSASPPTPAAIHPAPPAAAVWGTEPQHAPDAPRQAAAAPAPGSAPLPAAAQDIAGSAFRLGPRVAVYLACAAVALAVAALGVGVLQLEQRRDADAALQQHASAQGTVAQQAGRLAALLALGAAAPSAPNPHAALPAAETAAAAPAAPVADTAQMRHADALAALIRHSRADALPVDAALARALRAAGPAGGRGADAAAGAGAQAALQATVGRWHAARDQLWAGSDALLQAAAAGDPESLRRAAQALQAEVAQAAQAAAQLSALLAHDASVSVARSRQQLQYGAGGVFALLLLSLALVEPALRAARTRRGGSGGSGGSSGIVRVATDGTPGVQQQGKLQALWAVLPAGVVVHDAQCRVVEANREAERLLGLTLAQMRNARQRPTGWRPLREDGSPFALNDHPAARTLATGEPVRNETVGLLIGGGRRWLLFNTEPQRDALGQVDGVVSCISDITERRLLLEQLSASARTDALTLLPNRAVVMERLQRAIAHAQRHPGYGFAVLFMDFDRFKQVNDTLGHAAGDTLLRQIADRLQQALRPGDAVARLEAGTAGPHADAVAARLGGDEFVVVLEGVNDAPTVGVIAERLLHDLAEPYLLGSTPVQSSVSIGVVLCAGLGAAADSAEPGAEPGAAPTAADVLRNADTAMYEAKRAGRGRWVLFDDSMHERVLRALALEQDLKRALRDDELFVVYQPIVNLATRALEGVEALVRWRHPQRGLVLPGDFIPAAEENGLIDALGAVVLRKACRQFMAWRRTPGAPAPRELAVNLSRAQLQRAGLVDDVRAVLADCGMPPALLQLEVTESLAAQDERVQATLRALKALGVRLALDDFGTGYSSLACLHQLPVDTVKIDRSFVQHAETVEYHRVLIEATVRVARTLGMTAVAEGIETEGQAALMRQLDCDRGQGYLFSRPVEAAELERWMQAQAPSRAARDAAASLA